jgi:hypothetical protein
MSKHDLTLNKVKEKLEYDPETGVLRWASSGPRIAFGKVAHCPITSPVNTVMVFGVAASPAQLAWFIAHGVWPNSKLIAVNGNKFDTRLVNIMQRAAVAGKPTADRLRQLVDYNPDTGRFTRKIRTSNRIDLSKPCGAYNSDGYLVTRIDGTKYPNHRLAWLYMTGNWPTLEIDHINGIRDDNRWANLREVTRAGNTQNTHNIRRPDGSYVGVRKVGNVFTAVIFVNKVRIKLGTFDTAEEAHAAYLAAKRLHHPTCTI